MRFNAYVNMQLTTTPFYVTVRDKTYQVTTMTWHASPIPYIMTEGLLERLVPWTARPRIKRVKLDLRITDLPPDVRTVVEQMTDLALRFQRATQIK